VSLSRRLLVACTTLAVFTPDSSHADIVDENFTERSYLGSLPGTATGMAWAPDGSNRLFVTTQPGSVWIVAHGDIPTPAERDTRLFATVTPIHFSGECGLLGLVFDPDFLVNHYVYFFVTVSASEQQIIRYTAEGDVGTNKTVIVAGLPTNGGNHNGGAIGVGPDGKLYWAIGDNGIGRGVNADLASLAAKVGRANLDGGVPNDNPFFDGDGPNADYIWARGLRNPFTMTFQPANGGLWLDVVGTTYEQIFVVNRGDHAGYSAYENNQPNGLITPIIKYRTNATDALALTPSGALRSASGVTFTTAAPHGFRRGEMITIAGVSDASFNGNVYVASTPSATTFTAIQTGPNAASGSGTAVTQALGGCVTGGTFYAATQFAPEYWGNYFFGDFNSGNIVRAVMSSPATIESVQIWGNVGGHLIDIETGPDGALYYIRASGEMFRAAFDATVQGLVVSHRHVWMLEGGEQSISVSLAIAPTADVVVNAVRTSGDPGIVVGAGARLTFTPANWSEPQSVNLSAATDADTLLDTAIIDVSSPALLTRAVTVNAVDRNSLVVSTDTLGIDEGASGTFTVALATQPSTSTTVSVMHSAGDEDIGVSSGAALTFTPADFATPQTVTIDAAEDADAIDDRATVALTANGLLSLSIAIAATDNDPLAPDAAPPVEDLDAAVLDAASAAHDASADAGAAGRDADSPPVDADSPVDATLDAMATEADGGSDATHHEAPGSDPGCGCRAPGVPASRGGLASALLVALVLAIRQRARARTRGI